MYQVAGKTLNRRGIAQRDEFLIEVVSRLVIESLSFGPQDVVLDTRCGDGFLLSHLPPGARRIGVVPSDEEITALKVWHPDGEIEFSERSHRRTSHPGPHRHRAHLQWGFIILPDEKTVLASLHEFRRVYQ